MARTSTAKKVSPAKVALPLPRFTIAKVEGGHITEDANTGLTWSHTLFGRSVVHAGAQELVDRINADKFGRHSDWRVPTIDELESIRDRSRYNPAIDTDAFPDTKSSWYWSSSPCAGHPAYAWGVYFGSGDAYWGSRDSYGFVRAVRGPVARAGQ